MVKSYRRWGWAYLALSFVSILTGTSDAFAAAFFVVAMIFCVAGEVMEALGK